MSGSGRRVVVVGMGRSGRAAAELALAQGASVTCVDAKADTPAVAGAAMELGPHRRETFLRADTIVVSPGVPAAQPDVAAARAAGIDVVGELAFAWRALPLPAIAVTGTNGKSTVTSFVGHLLRTLGRRVFAGGNLGTPYSEAALAALRGEGPEVAVLEVSSYQMELPGGFDPRVGVILNLTPDHLARHGTMESYGAHKCRVFERMRPTDLAMVPDGDALLTSLARGVGAGRRIWLGGAPGVVVEGMTAKIRLPGRAWTWSGERLDAPVSVDLDLSGVTVPGAHNREHAATAAALTIALGADPADVQRALAGLVALPHRMEPVGQLDGVPWINDSKATNVESTLVGVRGVSQPSVVLLGGEAKGPGFAPLVPALGGHRAVVCFGGSGSLIEEELLEAGLSRGAPSQVGPPVYRVARMVDALALARTLARPGDAVLLSPACASFDEFRNFEHRGDVFRAWVQGGGA